MHLDQLTYVLDYMDTSLHDTELFVAYARLIEAVEQVQAGDMAMVKQVQSAREQLVALHETLQTHGWSAERLAILNSYHAQAVLGSAAIEQIQRAFIENFMHPAGVLARLHALHADTLLLAERITLLLKGLDPVLTDLPAQTAGVLEGEVLDVGELRPIATPSRNPLALFKSKLPLPQRKSTALVRIDDVPLATKLMAAAPVVIAAASKAIEVYQAYAKTRTVSVKPAEKAMPIRPKPTITQTNAPASSYMHYSYTRSVYITTRDE